LDREYQKIVLIEKRVNEEEESMKKEFLRSSWKHALLLCSAAIVLTLLVLMVPGSKAQATVSNPILVNNWSPAGGATAECATASSYTGVTYTGATKFDPPNSGTKSPVTISVNETTKKFSWSSNTQGISAVIVKASTKAYIYTYSQATSGSGLIAPDEKEISHITFCWNVSCPVGQVLSGGSCVTACQWNSSIPSTSPSCQPPTCGYGTIWDGTACVWQCLFNPAIPSTSPACHPACYPGTVWDGTTCVWQCLFNPAIPSTSPDCHPSCPTGQTWNGTTCVIDSCPVDQLLIGGECVDACEFDATIPASSGDCHAPCADNEIWDGTACVIDSCPVDQLLIGGECVDACEFDATIPASSGDCHAPCATNETWNGTACVIDSCPVGQLLIEGECVDACEFNAAIPASSADCHEACAEGETWNGESCVPNSCPTGEVLINDVCVTACASNPSLAADDPGCALPPPPPPVIVLSGLSVVLDPFCSVDGQMQWTVENPNSVTVYVTDWTVDGAHMGPLFATPGSTRLTATVLGTHTVTLYYDDGKTASLTDSLSACPLTIPVTGTGGLLIPVTGADLSAKIYLGLLCAGLSLTGIALLRKQLLKRLTH
jgi:hypothetical protein